MKPELVHGEMLQVWVTKRWQTQGIFSETVEYRGDITAQLVRARDGSYFWLHRECFLERDEAVARAYLLRDRAIEACQKKMKHLSTLEF